MKNMPRAAEGLSIKAVVMKFLVKRKMRTVALISRCKKITFSCDSGKASFFQALQTNEESHIKSTKKLHGYCSGKEWACTASLNKGDHPDDISTEGQFPFHLQLRRRHVP